MPPPAPAGGDPGPLKKLDERRTAVVLPKKGGAKADPKIAQPWPARKLVALRSAPNADRLTVLYSKDVAATIRREASERCLRWAEQEKPDLVARSISEIQAGAEARGKTLTDAQAREVLLERHTFDFMSPLEPLSVMHARGLTGDPITFDRANTGAWSPDPNQAIAAAVPDKPGTYVFAVHMAGLSDASPALTLVVEKKADGSSTTSQIASWETPARDPKQALDVPLFDHNPSRDGSRAVLVYPLNPAAAGGKK